jgi:CPA2 family monovalent cation:H+ antiporter-2
VLFFVSVGMLFNPAVLAERPLQVLAVTAIIVVGKSIAAALLVLAMRYPLNTALTVSISLAQIGEFSFILVALGATLGVLPPEGQSLVVAGALVSIALNPLLFSLNEPLRRWLLARSALARRLETRDDPLAALPASTESRYLAKHVVLVGYGSVGKQVAAALAARDQPFVVVEQNRERVQELRDAGRAAVSGNAVEPVTLVQAHVAKAALLVITLPETTDVLPIVETARTLNPAIGIIVRAANEDEAARLAASGLDHVVHPRGAIAMEITNAALQRIEGRT